jgi:hypothetical protein
MISASWGDEVPDVTNPQQMLAAAAEHLRTALQLLDSAEASPHIGAHIDLALYQLEAALLERSSEALTTPERSRARH